MSNAVASTVKNTFEHLRDEVASTFDRWRERRRHDGAVTRTDGEPFWAPSLFARLAPDVDVEENENEVRVRAELPGLDKDDFRVEVAGNRLVIRGEKKGSREKRTRGAYYAECRYGSFSRSVSLPCEVDVEKADARYERGVLSLRLPKTEMAKSRRIPVEVK